ncbi:MAG: AAA family ATPase [Chitinophagales bacterium]
MKKLPLGKQNFKEIIEDGYLYVDKTHYVHQLVSEASLYFLSRPRRFGKSLLLSTIAHLFNGEKALFEGLHIAEKADWEWEKFPVLQFNFAKFGHKVTNLTELLSYQVEEYAEVFNVQLKHKELSLQLEELVSTISENHKPVVFLVDEYDKPIIDFITDKVQAKINRDALRSFFSPLKDLEAKGCLRLLFITGVSKFSKVSLFSDLNNLTDLTIDPVANTLLGITHQELSDNFGLYIEATAKVLDMSEEKLIEGMKEWYDGYSWDGENFVYNPYSLLNFFRKKRFGNFWFSTGTPTFLVRLLQKENAKPKDIEGKIVTESSFDKFDLDHLDIYMLLFQTGYLTVKKTERRRYRLRYTLGYPNQEVREAFTHNLLEAYTHQSPTIVSDAMVRMEDALQDNDLEEFIGQLKVLFSNISYHLLPKIKRKDATEADEAKAFDVWEGYFQTVIYLMTTFLGLAVQSEITHHKGRLDLLIEAEDYLYLMELKLEEDAADAITQIKSREYLASYRNSPKTVVLLGVSFDKEERNVKSWKAEQWRR